MIIFFFQRKQKDEKRCRLRSFFSDFFLNLSWTCGCCTFVDLWIWSHLCALVDLSVALLLLLLFRIFFTLETKTISLPPLSPYRARIVTAVKLACDYLFCEQNNTITPKSSSSFLSLSKSLNSSLLLFLSSSFS